MRSKTVSLLGALLLVAALGQQPRAAPVRPDPIPIESPLWDEVQLLCQAGADSGFPLGTFQGRKPLPRSDFAKALHTMVAEAVRRQPQGRRWNRYSYRPSGLASLLAEFRVELAARGVAPRVALEGLAVFEQAWSDPRPRGTGTPLPGFRQGDVVLCWPEDATAQDRGRRAAVAEIARGELSLWSVGDVREEELDGALPLKPVPSGGTKKEQVQAAAGHNAAIWAELREHPSRYPRYRAWAVLVKLHRAWREAQRGGDLETTLTAPDGRYTLERTASRLCYTEVMAQIKSPTGQLDVPLGPYAAVSRRVQVKWGPSDSGLVFIRPSWQEGRRRHFYLLAVDRRSGEILAVEAG